MSDYLIDEKYLKETVSISPNLDSTTAKKSIAQVSRISIEELVSTTLLDYLVTTPNLTPVYSKILPDIKLYFALRVHHDMLSTLGIKTTNKSNALASDSTSDIASIKLEMSFIEDKYLLLKADILAYLTTHAAEMPEYRPKPSNKRYSQIAFTPAYRNQIYGG